MLFNAQLATEKPPEKSLRRFRLRWSRFLRALVGEQAHLRGLFLDDAKQSILLGGQFRETSGLSAWKRAT